MALKLHDSYSSFLKTFWVEIRTLDSSLIRVVFGNRQPRPRLKLYKLGHSASLAVRRTRPGYATSPVEQV
jgi:hypothetical protein